MRYGMRTLGGCVALAVVLALTACVPTTPKVIPTADPMATPIFATDADALAAAKKAYEGYNAASDQIARDGGRNPERIAPWVASSWLPTELKGWKSLENSKRHIKGSTTYTSFTLQRSSTAGGNIAEVGVYVCEDLSRTRVLDASNHDVTPADRSAILPLEVRFDSAKPSSATLVLAESQPWSGENFCS